MSAPSAGSAVPALSQPGPGTPAGRSPGIALALLALAQLVIALDYNIVFVALPEIGRDLGFTAQNIQWVVSGYAVVFGGFLLLGGRAADLIGRRRVFVAALGLYGAGSLLGGLATGPWTLVAARAVQGLGGALLFPATLSLVTTTFAEGTARNRALAVWGAAGSGGLALGSLAGGVLTDAFGWPAVFYVNVPFAVVIAVLALRYIEPDGPRKRGSSFDVPGALTATIGLTTLVLSLVRGPEVGWGATQVVAGFVVAAVFLALFAVVESRSRDPLMPLRLLRNRSLLAAMAVTFTFGTTFSSMYYFFTVYLQDLQGYGALAAGFAFLPLAVMCTAGTQVGERLIGRIGLRATLASGLLLGVVGFALLGQGMHARGSFWNVIAGVVMTGLGQGIVWTAMWIASAVGVREQEQGMSSGMASTALQAGATVGLAVLVAVQNSGLDTVTGPAFSAGLADGLRDVTRLASLFAAAGIVVVLLALRRRTVRNIVVAEAGARAAAGERAEAAPDHADHKGRTDHGDHAAARPARTG